SFSSFVPFMHTSAIVLGSGSHPSAPTASRLTAQATALRKIASILSISAKKEKLLITVATALIILSRRSAQERRAICVLFDGVAAARELVHHLRQELEPRKAVAAGVHLNLVHLAPRVKVPLPRSKHCLHRVRRGPVAALVLVVAHEDRHR